MSAREGGVGTAVLTCPGADQAARWRPGERLEEVFEEYCDRHPERLAVDCAQARLTVAGLDAVANRVAHHLRALGVVPGDRVGLLVDQPARAYGAMLAVMKAGAVYVPLDAAFPDDRLAYIAEDAGLRAVLTLSAGRDRWRGVPVDVVCLDELDAVLAGLPATRPTSEDKGGAADGLCYVVYTSGSTGRPKGVTVGHSAICNFVRAAGEVYGIEPGDRVYQGMTIAFDFSVEEIWVPLLAGATLVPRPPGAALVGHELGEFLRHNGITALCCVPTLLATLDDDVPDLRFLLVSGEACPEDLVDRWHRPDRRFLNVYGPTEATVTATWTPVRPDRPVTIGVPLPTYSVVVLDPDGPRALDRGETGEIGIAGIGLATGYLNRPDLTERAFVPDFLGLPDNPSGRIYRTGDLGRVGAGGEVEYLGRIDTQVKIRGYRVEPTEVESVLLQVPGVAQAVVEPHRPEPGVVELVAYYSLRRDAVDPGAEEIYRRLRDRLPGYMVPTHLERLDLVPMTPSGKADRRNLPPPRSARGLASGRPHVPPADGVERDLADALARALRVERVSADADFFADLGADSLLLARFCAGVRRDTDLPPVPMRDVYAHRSVRALAAALADAPVEEASEPAVAVLRAGTARYLLCGLAQALVFLAYACGAGLLLDTGLGWVADATGPLDGYLRAVAAAGAGFAAVCLLPIAAKWVLIGRWTPGEFPLWGLRYLRFWTVRTLIAFSPLALFVGSPLYALYLRALGARIGAGALFLTRYPPVCADLLTVGAGAVVRKDSYLTGYRLHGGRVRTGRVTLGAGAFVGEMSVLDVDTALGDDAQLGHASSLHVGQSVPAGEVWHGSPARPSTVDYRVLADGPARRGRRVVFGLGQLLVLLLVPLPAVLLGTDVVIALVGDTTVLTGAAAVRAALRDSAVLYFGGLVAGLLAVLTVPRLLAPLLRPDRAHPLYGWRYSAHQAVFRLTNLRAFTYLFGDSSAIVHYLRALGYRLGRFTQTGSNFGVEIRHESPALCEVGVGTMVSDGLSLLNAEFSATSFRLRRVRVPGKAFLGNNIAYPPEAKVGADCLLATKVLVPLDGPPRTGTGLLGSPAFPIPRTVARDTGFAGVDAARGVAGKNRHNAVTALVYLLVHWAQVFGVVLIGVAAGRLHTRVGWLSTAADLVLTVVFSVCLLVLAERAVQGFRPLRPRFCSIYDPVFWRHERFWKLSAGRYLVLFNGTPLKNALWRLLGVRIGRRVCDDGCAIPEKSLVAIGDDCSLNIGSTVQAHSLEDGAFKSDHVVLGAGVTVGTGAFVHYGASLGTDAVLEPDSFLMKGTEVAEGSRWRGNPAVELTGAGSPVRRTP
ncbi:Pls/PosA family non-ribosomal peptide synthetase [Actinosynnema sp. NPDC020468]|uniref:Pls/PosA family non-ribosomal peptide synthetase n=1 Tax=Actinosynnema sp. NPDC020468 TaxID=3154488 RepID=UPI0033C3998B